MGTLSADKSKALDGLLSQINKKYAKDGDRMISRLTDAPMKVETVSSGSLVLDQILGGGLAKGRVIEIYGPESSGKTSIAVTAVGNVQKEGGTAVFIDAENAFDPRYAAKLGVDCDNLMITQPNSAEQILDLTRDLIASELVDIIVIDSVAAMVPQSVLENNAEDVTVGLLARLLSKELPKIVQLANKHKTTVIFINQTRDKIGGFSPYGTPQVTSGGKALKFYASQRIEVKKKGPVKADSGPNKGKEIGTQVGYKIIKNKVAPPFGVGDSVLTFNRGINLAAEMVAVGKEYGVIDMPNNRTYVEAATGDIFAKSRAEAIEVLDSNSELLARLQEALRVNIQNDMLGLSTEAAEESDEVEDLEEDEEVGNGSEEE